MRRLVRTVRAPLPVTTGRRGGLEYTLWLPARDPVGGAVVLHGAGSCKESHHDYARALVAAGLAAVLFDQRGHGASDGPMGAGVLKDVVLMADLLRAQCGDGGLPLALRGSSMGGCLAILAAPLVEAHAVVAICPADPVGLRRGLRSGTLRFDADVEALDGVLAGCDLYRAVEELPVPLLLLHAAGDEQVPVEFSHELARHFRADGSRLIVVPGGHHRSVQHDPELQAVSVRFLVRAITSQL